MRKTTVSIAIETLLETSAMKQLTSNTRVYFGDGRDQRSKRVQSANIQFIPAVSDGILTVKAKTRSETNQYETVIQFNKVSYVPADRQFAVPIEIPGQEVYIMPLKALGNDVHVHCTCMDFYWRFAMYNNKNDSLLGEPPAPYVKKTNRKPVNPDQIPGACKHLTALADMLKRDGILK